MTHVTCWLTAKHRNPTLGNRVWATFYTAGRQMSVISDDCTAGRLRTVAVLDRESLCPAAGPPVCTLTLDVVVTPRRFFHIIRVAVDVQVIQILNIILRNFENFQGPF